MLRVVLLALALSFGSPVAAQDMPPDGKEQPAVAAAQASATPTEDQNAAEIARLEASLAESYKATGLALGKAAEAKADAGSGWWSTANAMTMCGVVLAFGVLVLGLATYLMKVGKDGSSVLRIFGTILVVVMATFLVVAGYDKDQIGAPLALLGTIAGYLLGKDPVADRTRDDETKP